MDVNLKQKINNWHLFTREEREQIKNDFLAFISSEKYVKLEKLMNLIPKIGLNSRGKKDLTDMHGLGEIIEIDKQMKEYNKIPFDHRRFIYSAELKKIRKMALHVLRGIFISNIQHLELQIIYEQLQECSKEKVYWICENSMTAWVNRAAENISLTAGDIRAMKKGQKIAVILMDRNIGDYLENIPINTKFDPLKEGCTYADYVHDSDLSGRIKYDFETDYRPFTWEINGTPFGESFWTPISSRIGKIPDNIPVGWRGPSVLRSTAAKYLPRKVMRYGTWFDDYVIIRYTNLVKMK